MTALSTAEISTLETIADRDSTGGVSRTHLEKLSRLDLIEPCPEGVCMTQKGRTVLGVKK
jgi:hypothetical protein